MAETDVATPPQETAPSLAPAAGPAADVFGEPIPDYSHLSSPEVEDPNSQDSLAERFRLHRVDSYYRGTLAGASRLAIMAGLASKPESDMSDDEKAFAKDMVPEFHQILGDLNHYDKMRPWGTTAEATAALTGSLVGGAMSPESWLGAPAGGTGLIVRTARAAVQQAAIAGTVDPIVQWLNMSAGVQQDYDPWRTVSSAGLGLLIGGGLHLGGELISSATARQVRADLDRQAPGVAEDVAAIRGLDNVWGDSARDYLKGRPELAAFHPHEVEGFSNHYATAQASRLGWTRDAATTVTALGHPEWERDWRTIADDVRDGLVSAGMSRDQADATAAVAAARYVTRAARLEGRAGTPLQIFRDQGIEFRGSEAAADEGRAFEQPQRPQGPGDISAGPYGRTMQFEEDRRNWRDNLANWLRNRTGPDLPVLRQNYALRAIDREFAGPVTLPRGRALAILNAHQDIPADTWRNLPELLADPLAVYRYTGAGGQRDTWNVVTRATTAKGEPIVVGVRDGEVHTVTPFHDDPTTGATGWDRVARFVSRELRPASGQPAERVYIRDADAAARVGAGARTAGQPAGAGAGVGNSPPRRGQLPGGANLPYTSRVPEQQSWRPARNVTTLDQVVQRQGRVFYQGPSLDELTAVQTAEHPARIHQRLPTAVGADLSGPPKLVDVATMKAETPEAYAHNARLLTAYLPREFETRSPDDITRAFRSLVVNNLTWLYNQIPQTVRDRSKLWYVGGRRLVEDWAQRYGVNDSTAAGVLAALSPKADWYRNVSWARRVLEMHKGYGPEFYNQFRATPEMRAAFETRPNMAVYAPQWQLIEGRSLGDIDRMDLPDAGGLSADEQSERRAWLKALWTRFYDETYHTPRYGLVAPEGEVSDVVRTGEPAEGAQFVVNDGDGNAVGRFATRREANREARRISGSVAFEREPASAGWGGGLDSLTKALRILDNDGDHAFLQRIVGTNAKVRNFYNNLLNPYSRLGDVTIDTHAVAAALLRPLSQEDRAVKHNFGQGMPGETGPANRNSTGLKGLYAFYADAYREAARKLGLLPRELQSITWEAVRELFPAAEKGSLRGQIDSIWEKYRDGEIKRPDAVRRQILQAAAPDGRIPDPVWYRTGAAQHGAAADARELSSPELPGGPAEGNLGGGGGRLSGVGPERLPRPWQVGEPPPGTERQFFQHVPPFYSAVERGIEGARQERATPAQWLGTIKNLPGIKPEELRWLGIEDWLNERGQPGDNRAPQVTRQEILDYVRAHRIDVQDVHRIAQSDRQNLMDDRAEAIARLGDAYDGMADKPVIADRVLPRQGFLSAVRTGVVPADALPVSLQPLARRYLDTEARVEATAGIGSTKFGTRDLVLPGGQNYRELLLTVPRIPSDIQRRIDALDAEVSTLEAAGDPRWREVSAQRGELLRSAPPAFRGSHWDEPNVLAHVRFNDRTINGKRTLFVEEVQSDWGQQGRERGFTGEEPPQRRALIEERDRLAERAVDAQEASDTVAYDVAMRRITEINRQLGQPYGEIRVPAGPFVQDTSTWSSLAMKRIIRYAAENGYDQVAWTTGETQAQRYNMRRVIENIHTGPATAPPDAPRSGSRGVFFQRFGFPGEAGRGVMIRLKSEAGAEPTIHLLVDDDGAIQKASGVPQGSGDWVGKNLSEVIGKGLADKVMDEPGKVRLIEGEGLEVGGEGHQAFYDRILPNTVNRIVRKYGAKVETGDLARPYHLEVIQGGDYAVHGPVYPDGSQDVRHFTHRDEAEAYLRELRRGASPGQSTPVWTLPLTDDLKTAAMEQGFPLFQRPAGEGEPRGRVTFTADDRRIIDLFKAADASTALHELGHVWLEELIADARRADAPQPLKNDLDAVLNWFGVDHPHEITTEHHEQWARAFEQYLRTGEAPSTALEGVFARLKEWLTAIYRSVTALGAPVSDEMKGVFDRLLATDEAIAARGEALGRPDIQAIATRRSGATLRGEPSRPGGGVGAQAGTQAGTQVGPPAGTAVGPPATPTGTGTIPGPTPQQQGTIQSLQRQVTALARALGMTLREGRVELRQALGTFNTRTGVTRVREIPDLAVVAHEAGHHIEARIGQDLTDLINRYANELGPLDYAYPQQARPFEGFAELVRYMIANPPAYAQNAAPGFYGEFRRMMAQRAPEMLQGLDDANTAFQAYLAAPSHQVVGAAVRSSEEEGGRIRQFVTRLREQGLPDTIRTWLASAYTRVLDDKAPVARAVRDLARAIQEADPNHALVGLRAAENPEYLVRMAARSQQAAVLDMMEGIRPYHDVTPQGPALRDAISRAVGDPSRMGFGKWDPEALHDFSTYLVARRTAVLWERFERGDLPNPPAAFSRADALQTIADLEAANPNFRAGSDMVHGYTRELLRKQFEGGLIDRDLYDKLLQDPFYVPLMRDMRDKPLASGGSAGSGAPGAGQGPGMTSTVRRLTGSARDILDPLESIMMQTFLVNRTLAHNDVIRSFVALARRAGSAGGQYVEALPAHEARRYTFDLGDAIRRKAIEAGSTPQDAQLMASQIAQMFGQDPLMGSFFSMEPTRPHGEPIVFYREGGDLKVARFSTEQEGHALYETLTALPAQIADVFHGLVRGVAFVNRLGIVTNPTFALSNYIRDQLAVSLLRSDYVPLASGVRGIASELGQGEAARLYAYMGGVAGGAATGPVERAAEAEVQALARRGYLVNRVTSFNGLMELASFTEAGTRNSVFDTVYQAKKAQGLSDYEAAFEAAYQAQDLLDFSRHGSRTLWLRNALPFINAHVQGLDKAWRTIVAPLLRRPVLEADSPEFNNALMSVVKVGGVGAALGAAYAAINWDKEAYRDVSPYFKGTHFVVPWGRRLIMVPKPFELSIPFTAGEYAYARLARDDPRAARQFADAAWQVLQPPNPFTGGPLVSTYTELAMGRSLFTGTDIVPERLQGLPPQLQYTDRTSAVAKRIGDVIGVSPMKVDYAIGSFYGTWGRDLMTLSRGIDEDSPTANWDDSVFFRRFIKDPTRSSDVTTRFWNYMAHTTGTFNQAVNGYLELVRRGSPHEAAAQAFLDALPNNEKAYTILKSAGNDFGRQAFSADIRRLHPLERAYDAVEVTNNIRRDLVDNNLRSWQDRQPIRLDPDTRRDLLDDIRELGQMEMRNAFVIMKEPGYASRPLLDVHPVFERIAHISPQVAEEIQTRYATARIYTTEAVARAYPAMERDLIRDGSSADLLGPMLDAKGEGYEFEGTRVRRPMRPRVVIPGAEMRP